MSDSLHPLTERVLGGGQLTRGQGLILAAAGGAIRQAHGPEHGRGASPEAALPQPGGLERSGAPLAEDRHQDGKPAAAAGEVALDELMRGADRIRVAFRGNAVGFCSILNVKASHCGENCTFCAQSALHHTAAPVYPLLKEEACARSAREASRWGSRHFGLVAAWRGLDSSSTDLEATCRDLEAVRDRGAIEAHASLGILDAEAARRLAAAGCVEYNHNLETSERFFPKVCSTHTYRERVETIRHARAAGMRICSGGIFGLGESWEDRVDLALTLRELEPDTVPINFLHPIEGTPLADRPVLSADEALRIIALYRYLLPRQDIKVCGGRELVLGEAQSRMFHAGASSAMLGHYLTTSGRTPEDDIEMVRALGLPLLTHPDPVSAPVGAAGPAG